MNNRSFDGMAAAAQRRHGTACVIAVVAAVALVPFSACSSPSDNSPPAASAAASNVTLTAAQRQNIHLFVVESSKFHKTTEATGIVDFDNDQATSVLAPFSGPVSRLLVSLGDEVKKAAPLASVASPDYSAAVSAYRKSVATARTDRRLADLDKDLLEHHGISQREENQAQTDAIDAEADRDAALQALISLQVDPQTIKDIQEEQPVSHPEALIRAPIAGTVVEKFITPGQLLQAGTTPCFTVADLSRVWVMAQLFGSDLDSVSRGDPAEIVTGLSAGSSPGTVDNIAALVDPDTRSVQVRVVADNPGNLLKKQMYVRVLIKARQESSGLLVPVSALLRDNENLSFVYVAKPDGSFARQHVTLGYRAGEQVVVADGLQAGDKIVVEGAIFVQFMQNQ
jgi:cobalt-zinc-cadmium efflux system membrane fusion protein